MAFRKFEVGKFYAYTRTPIGGLAWAGYIRVMCRIDNRNLITFEDERGSIYDRKIKTQAHCRDEYVVFFNANETRYGILIQAKIPYDTREEVEDAVGEYNYSQGHYDFLANVGIDTRGDLTDDYSYLDEN